ncbi:hypothetical protein [Sphingomonas sp.]|uniref:hypothetical protein n=1 Tax=Sphingomonas sp. TaxID=28214 RepID=UPI003B3BCB99
MMGRLLAFLMLAMFTAGAARAQAMRDMVADFDAFAARTAGMAEGARVAAFKRTLGPILPGIYDPTSSAGDRAVARALAQWPVKRGAILDARDRARAAYRTGLVRFGRAFPGFRPTMPVYLIHSLGQMDGGTREIRGRAVLMFGADVIADIHAGEAIAPLVDHELFHTYHQRFFADCPQLWCPLWAEGLATYVTVSMNPNATDSELLLDYPAPIRAATDARMRQALCHARANLDTTDETLLSSFTDGSHKGGPYPARFGYYLGYRIAEHMGRDLTLDQLARLKPAEVRDRIARAIDSYGRCGNATD